MNIEQLCHGIGLHPDATRFVLEYRMERDQYELAKRQFDEDYTSFFERITQLPDYRGRLLYLFIRFAVDRYEEYKKRGIDDGIYYDTFSDIRIWCMACKREFGEYGIQEYGWFKEHLRMRLFRLGRLQFHPYAMKSEVVTGGMKVYQDQIVLNVHIPEGEPLSPDKVEESFEHARRFFRGVEPVFVCHTWMLEPKLRSVLNEDSNILRFQRHFDIYKLNPDSRQAEERIFGKVCSQYAEYAESTSLQRSVKSFLMSGGRLGSASGIKA